MIVVLVLACAALLEAVSTVPADPEATPPGPLPEDVEDYHPWTWPCESVPWVVSCTDGSSVASPVTCADGDWEHEFLLHATFSTQPFYDWRAANAGADCSFTTESP